MSNLIPVYIMITTVMVVVTLIGTVICYFDSNVAMKTSRLWAKAFCLSFVWPVILLLIVGAVYIWAFGSDPMREKVFG